MLRSRQPLLHSTMTILPCHGTPSQQCSPVVLVGMSRHVKASIVEWVAVSSCTVQTLSRMLLQCLQAYLGSFRRMGLLKGLQLRPSKEEYYTLVSTCRASCAGVTMSHSSGTRCRIMARERHWMRPCHLRLAESGRQWHLPGTSDVEACSAVMKHEWTAELCPSCSDLVQISKVSWP